MSRHDPRPPRVPGSQKPRSSNAIKWNSSDAFAYSAAHLHALDRIGQALHVLDICPCEDCRADVMAALEVYDEL